MLRIDPRARYALAAGIVVLGLVAADKPQVKPTPATKLGADEVVSDVAEIRGVHNLPVEGVGLIIGLDNTGSDPEPSPYRKKLVDAMLKAEVPNPNELLASKRVAMVIVRAQIPRGVDPTDKFDVEVVPTTASTTTSLAGGYLLLTELTQMMETKGEVREGQVLAYAYGPVMTGTTANPDDQRSGRVLEGAHVRKALPIHISLHEDRKSYYAAKLVENTVNRRFHGRQGVEQKGMADAKTDATLVLQVPAVYHQNQDRYFQVVRLLQLSSTPEQLETRTARWAKELLDPATAGMAALRLEAIGENAIAILRTGLESSDPKVRFFAAEALAYLRDGSGAEVLAETASKNADFRIHALAALAAMDLPAGTLRLRKLMDDPDLGVRYGAFTALRKADPTHQALGRVRLVEPPPGDDDDEDAMALRLGPSIVDRPRKAPLPEDPFGLYVVEGTGPTSIHVSKSRTCEVVIFGRNVELLTPVVLGGGGAVQINASEYDQKVEISKIAPSQRGRSDVKVVSSPSLPAVLRTLVRLNVSYPEIVALLEAANAQRNLPGPLLVDALPAATPKYQEAQLEGLKVADGKGRKDAAVGRASAEVKSGDGKPKRSWGLKLPRPSWDPRDWFRPRSESK
jgi:flagellar basal body P-ring protein FlgI